MSKYSGHSNAAITPCCHFNLLDSFNGICGLELFRAVWSRAVELRMRVPIKSKRKLTCMRQYHDSLLLTYRHSKSCTCSYKCSKIQATLHIQLHLHMQLKPQRHNFLRAFRRPRSEPRLGRQISLRAARLAARRWSDRPARLLRPQNH